MKKFIKTTLKEYLNISESYKSITEISKLSNYLAMNISREIYNKYLHLDSDYMTIHNVFDNINISEFSELKKFIESNFLSKIVLEFGKIKINKAAYNPSDKSIIIYLSNEKIIDSFKQSNKDESGIYFSLNLKITLNHELQHAYDDFNSNGKFIGKDHEKDIYKRRNTIINQDYLKSHLNLIHEINARITQTINSFNFYTEEYEDTSTSEEDNSVYIVHKMLPFQIVKDKFINKYDGWHHLSEKNKKYILNKLGKYYLENETNVKEFNDRNIVKYF